MLYLVSADAERAGLGLDPQIDSCLKALYARRMVLDQLIRALEIYQESEILPSLAADRREGARAATH